MKKIEAFIRPEKLQPVKEALLAKNVKGITIHQVQGHGTQKGMKLLGRAGEYTVEFLDKVKVELVVDGGFDIEDLIKVIADAARTGAPGDGKIFISPVEDAIRIRTMERGDKAV